jgi:hypothetical protein
MERDEEQERMNTFHWETRSRGIASSRMNSKRKRSRHRWQCKRWNLQRPILRVSLKVQVAGMVLRLFFLSSQMTSRPPQRLTLEWVDTLARARTRRDFICQS